MSFLDRFLPASMSKPNEAATNAGNVNPPTNPPPGNNNPSAGNNNNPPPNGNPANQQQQQNDPLAPFAKMFDNAPNAEAPPSFNLDPKQLAEVAKTQNFVNGVDPALLERAQTGDSKALLEIIGAVGQNAYQAALAHGSKLTDTFVQAREAHNAKGFGNKVRSELVNAELGSTLNFSNPVVRNQLTRTAADLQRQHPDASPAEIKRMAVEYITELANAINPNAGSREQDQRKPEVTNFDEWLDT